MMGNRLGFLPALGLTGFALVLVACSSGDGTRTVCMDCGFNGIPSPPTVTIVSGPLLALHPLVATFQAVDPEADPITYLVNGTPVAGNSYSVTPQAAGPISLTVVARDSKGGLSQATVFSNTIGANHSPSFTSSDSPTASAPSPVFSQGFLVTATDQDGDEIAYALAGTTTILDNLGRSVPGASLSLQSLPTGGMLSFQGTVPAGAAWVRAQAQVQAADRLPGGTTLVGTSSTQDLTFIYANTLANHAPSAPAIVGPTTAITLHPAYYNLSSVDPEGDPISFVATGTGFSSSGNTATLIATASGASVLKVVAKDSTGASSPASTLTVQVAANRAPQFTSLPTGQLHGTSSTINWTSFQVTAQDPDTDEVAYAITGTPTFVDNAGAAVPGCSVAIAPGTGMVTFTGTVPSGSSSVTATFTVQAVDALPGSGAILSASATQVVSLTYTRS